MKNSFTFLILMVLIFSCKSKVVNPQNDNIKYNVTVSFDTIFTDKISIRAILIDKNKVWYAADKNRFGYFDLKINKHVERKISKDSLQLEFRSIAQTEKALFVLSIGNPALLYKINKKDLSATLVYEENHEKVFYDAIQFYAD